MSVRMSMHMPTCMSIRTAGVQCLLQRACCRQDCADDQERLDHHSVQACPRCLHRGRSADRSFGACQRRTPRAGNGRGGSLEKLPWKGLDQGARILGSLYSAQAPRHSPSACSGMLKNPARPLPATVSPTTQVMSAHAWPHNMSEAGCHLPDLHACTHAHAHARACTHTRTHAHTHAQGGGEVARGGAKCLAACSSNKDCKPNWLPVQCPNCSPVKGGGRYCTK